MAGIAVTILFAYLTRKKRTFGVNPDQMPNLPRFLIDIALAIMILSWALGMIKNNLKSDNAVIIVSICIIAGVFLFLRRPSK